MAWQVDCPKWTTLTPGHLTKQVIACRVWGAASRRGWPGLSTGSDENWWASRIGVSGFGFETEIRMVSGFGRVSDHVEKGLAGVKHRLRRELVGQQDRGFGFRI